MVSDSPLLNPAVTPTHARVIQVAREFVGTPYRHQGSLAGFGCDCIGLVRGVWRALYGAEPVEIPPYTPDWGEVGNHEVMLDLANQHLVGVSIGEEAPGDVLIFRMRSRGVAKHCAILVTPKTMIHSQSRDYVREVSLSMPWRRLIVGVFQFPPLVGEPHGNPDL